MAGVNVTIVGTITAGDETKQCTIAGIASLTGLEVGGGPMPPLSIWPSPGVPTHPIAPGGPPPTIWPNPPEGSVLPEHPIVLPPDLPPTMPPPDQRPIEWKTGWTQETGWVVVGVPTGPTPTPSK
jgi:hypothetical protein